MLSRNSTHIFSIELSKYVNFPLHKVSLTPLSSMKYLTNITSPTTPFFPFQMMSSMFPSIPHPKCNFNSGFSTSSHKPSGSNLSSSKSFGFPPKIASLSLSPASETLSVLNQMLKFVEKGADLWHWHRFWWQYCFIVLRGYRNYGADIWICSGSHFIPMNRHGGWYLRGNGRNFWALKEGK